MWRIYITTKKDNDNKKMFIVGKINNYNKKIFIFGKNIRKFWLLQK